MLGACRELYHRVRVWRPYRWVTWKFEKRKEYKIKCNIDRGRVATAFRNIPAITVARNANSEKYALADDPDIYSRVRYLNKIEYKSL